MRQRLRVFSEAFALLRRAAPRIAVFTVIVDVIGAISGGAMIAIAGRILGLLAADTTEWSTVVPWLIGAAFALAASMVSSSVHNDLASLAVEHVRSHAVEQVLDSASAVPFDSFDNPTFYDRLRRAHEGGSEHAWSIVQSTLNLVRGALDIAAIIVVLSFVAPVLIVIAIAAYGPMWLVTTINNRAIYSFSWDETEGDRRRNYLESLLGERRSAKEVRAFDLGPGLAREHRTLWDKRLRRLATVVKSAAVRSAFGYLASSLVVTSALAVVVWLTIRGRLTLDQAGVGVLGVRQLSNGVGRTSANIGALHLSGQFLEDYRTFHLEASCLAAEAIGQPAPTSVDTVELCNVSFDYPGGHPVLRDVSLELHKGQVAAVVGANGSGKTTLLMLLAGMYSPSDGVITWDGVDFAQFGMTERHRAVSPLFQDFMHYQFTVARNVDYRASDRDRLREALGVADANGFVDQLPDGIDTQLGKAFADGAELSAGQWQRLAFARAIFRDSPLLLLDEPASALDPGAEARLVTQLKARCRDQVVVLISHRFASVRHADVIFVLDEGRLIEHGTHETLVALGGAYNALYRAQADPLI